jgi:hypothetical protein
VSWKHVTVLAFGFAAPLAGKTAIATRPVADSESAAINLSDFFILNFPPKERVLQLTRRFDGRMFCQLQPRNRR